MSLEGRRVVVTRAPHQAGALADLLRGCGAQPILYPCIDISPSHDPAHQDAIAQLDTFDWLVVTSPNTVYALSRWHLQLPENIRVAAVGEKTAATVHSYLKTEVDFVPSRQLGAVLGAELPMAPGERVFLPKSARADGSLMAALCQRGADVTTVEAYQNDIGHGGADLPALIDAGQVDAITFTSGSTVENLAARLDHTPTTIPAACIGPSAGATAQHYGYEVVIVPEHDYSLNGMINALAAHYR